MILLLSGCSRSIKHSIPLDHTPNYPVIAHSHNDYEQEFPIRTALEHGFRSLEVDVMYDGLYIRVSHDNDHLLRKPKFEEAYLNRIIEILHLYSDGLYLLIDIKEYSAALITELNTILVKYHDHLVNRESPNDLDSKIKIILSGDFPRKQIIDNPSNIYLFVDGRLDEYSLEASSDIVPMISIDYTDIPKLSGRYNNQGKRDQKLIKTIKLVKATGKQIRFWKTKDKESTWLSLIDWGVDIIGVDNIECFYSVMEENGLIE